MFIHFFIKKIRVIIGYCLLAGFVFSHQNGIDCRNKACRTMLLTPVFFESNGKKVGLNISLQGKEETYAKWKFIVPKGFPLDTNVSLGRPFITANISCNVYENGLTSESWSSSYKPMLYISTYNPKTNMKSPEQGTSINLIDCGSGRNKMATSQNFFVNILEDDMEIEIILKRPGEEERIPTIAVNKDSLWLAYIFQKGEKPAFPDRYEPNNDASAATVLTEMRMPASIWDGVPIKPVDVDWYSLEMKDYGSFQIEVIASDESPNLKPSLKLYNDKLNLLSQTKGIKTAKLGWSGKGRFFLEVSNSAGSEGPSGHKYVLNIKK
ncbi:MAG: hypothetical protein AB1630_06155 [bacterium]